MRFFIFLLVLTALVSCGEDKGNTNTGDKCKNVACDEWELCNSTSGACETKENRCSDNGDCLGVQICDTNHNCINPIDPCEGQSCSNFGVCVIINNTAKCVSNEGYKEEGLTCVYQECFGAEIKTIECGFNNNGIEIVECINGSWVNSGNCFDNDNCLNNEERILTNGCGLNSRGTVEEICQNGEWIFNQCIDDDVCIDGTENLSQISCGYDYLGKYLTECITGQFVTLYECSIWSKQLGTLMQEVGKAITTDSNGNIYVTGWTWGIFANNTNLGDADVFLAKYNSSGDLLFVKQFGTSFYNDSSDIIIDNEGNIIISGRNGGNPGNMFLMKLNPWGYLIWNKTFSTTGFQESFSITVDGDNNIFAIGYLWGNFYGNINAGNEDGFIMKLNSSGDILLTKLIGTPQNERITSVKTDADNNIYLTGSANGTLGLQNFGGYDIFIAKYNNNLEQQWIKQFGSYSYEDTPIIALSNNDIYITALTGGSLDNSNPNQYQQALLLKYNISGDFVFAKQFAIEERTFPQAIEVKNNEIYIAGQTGYTEMIEGEITDYYDIFLVKYDDLGNSLLTKQFGTQEVAEYCNDMTIDTNDNMYFMGSTNGNLYDNATFGSEDAFLIKWKE